MTKIEWQVPVRGPMESGPWKIEPFTVSDQDAASTRLRAMLKGRGYVPAGDYARLTRNGTVIMSNTPDELRDAYGFVHQAIDPDTRRVLINGLGMGIIPATIMHHNPGMELMRIIEVDQHVIGMVAPALRAQAEESGWAGKLDIVCDDALKYTAKRGEKFDVVWHDIWDTICEDNLPEMTTLKRKYQNRAKHQFAWCEAECRRHRSGYYDQADRAARFTGMMGLALR